MDKLANNLLCSENNSNIRITIQNYKIWAVYYNTFKKGIFLKLGVLKVRPSLHAYACPTNFFNINMVLTFEF